MKTNIKLLATAISFLAIGINSLEAQNPKWSRNGDNIASDEWLGSTNNEPLLLKANNNLGIKIKPNGELIFKSLDLNSNSGPNGLVLTDGQGKIFRFDLTGNSSNILLGNGTWGTLPAGANSWNVVGNNIFSTNSGNIGIGTNNPLVKLDIVGDVSISNNLTVGGGIISAQQMDAYGLLKGGDVNVQNKLSIGSSNSAFKLSYTPPVSLDPAIFNYGDVINPPAPTLDPCVDQTPPAPILNQFGGMIRVLNVNSSSNYVAGTPILDVGTSNNKSYIGSKYFPLFINQDCHQNIYLLGAMQGFGTSSPAQKFHFTGGNILLDDVNAPTNNQVRFRVKAGNNLGACVETDHNFDFGFNTKLFVNRSTTHAIGVYNTDPSVTGEYFVLWGDGRTYIGKDMFHGNGSMLTVGQPNKNQPALQLIDNTNPNSTKEFFTVNGDGYTEIKIYNPNAMPSPGGSPRALTIKDMSSTTPKDIFVVNSNGKTYAREVEISLVATFPDYVFNKDYKLKTIPEVADYIEQNKHLPGFEKAAYYENNGINVNDMFIKQQEKIEELTLYIIELEKRLSKIELNK